MSASKKRKVEDPLAALVRRAVALRRELHAYPEPGFEEKETQRRIRAVLAELDVCADARTCAETGLVADIAGPVGKPPSDKNTVRCVALRSDMDALRMTEKNECLAHRSRHEGVAHMCGHDGHMASLVLAAALVARRKDRLPAGASVRLLFQPAEEGPGGALPMIMDGALEGVDECYGFHNWPSFPLGEVHVKPGALMAHVSEFTITVKGSGCHASQPHAGVDAVLAGSAVVQALHTITSRSTRSDENAVVSVTQFHAGEATNVLPDSAVLKGTIRDLDPAVFDLIEKRIAEVSAGVAAGYGATADVKIDSMCPPGSVCTFPAFPRTPIFPGTRWSSTTPRPTTTSSPPRATWGCPCRPRGCPCSAPRTSRTSSTRRWAAYRAAFFSSAGRRTP